MPDRVHAQHLGPAEPGTTLEGVLEGRQAGAANGPVAFEALIGAVETRLPDVGGSVPWYVTTVKPDLEARGVERVPGQTPRHLRLFDGAGWSVLEVEAPHSSSRTGATGSGRA